MDEIQHRVLEEAKIDFQKKSNRFAFNVPVDSKSLRLKEIIPRECYRMSFYKYKTVGCGLGKKFRRWCWKKNEVDYQDES